MEAHAYIRLLSCNESGVKKKADAVNGHKLPPIGKNGFDEEKRESLGKALDRGRGNDNVRACVNGQMGGDVDSLGNGVGLVDIERAEEQVGQIEQSENKRKTENEKRQKRHATMKVSNCSAGLCFVHSMVL